MAYNRNINGYYRINIYAFTEEQNREQYRTKKEEYKNFRYDTKGSVDSLRRDYKTYCKFWNEEQEMKKQKSNISPPPFFYGIVME